MSFNTNWNIEKYRAEYESEEQWELKKRFMLAHKNKFPEDRLVCLTQTFLNVEFLGCRYPKKTMDQVEELAKGIVDEYRVKKQARLKRTFVNASDAAEAKIKTSRYCPGTHKQPSCVYTQLNESFTPSNSSILHSQGQTFKNKEEELLNSRRLEILDKFNQKSELGVHLKFILIVDPRHLVPISILEHSSRLANVVLDFSFKKNDNLTTCQIKLDGELVAESSEPSRKASKNSAAKMAFELLKKHHYTIEKKCSFFNSGTVLNTKSGSTVEETPIQEDNVGLQMMLKMGWTGSGLGPSEQGIVTPVQPAVETVTRAGLGTDISSPSRRDINNKFRNIFKEFANKDSPNDLVFSSDLSIYERKWLHELAHKFNLKSHSFGKGNERKLVISNPFNPQKIVTDMLLSGQFENEKYKLIVP